MKVSEMMLDLATKLLAMGLWGGWLNIYKLYYKKTVSYLNTLIKKLYFIQTKVLELF